MFVTVVALKYTLLVSQWSYGYFLKVTDSILFEWQNKSSPFNSTHYIVLYPQNGDRIVTIDSVTSLQSMCIRNSRSVNRHDNKQHFGLNIKSKGSHFKNSEYAKSTMLTWRPSAIGLYRSLLFRPTGLSAPFIGAIIPTVSYSADRPMN